MKRKVKELAMNLYRETKKQFPEIEFINIQAHPEQAGRYWINVAGVMDEDREIAMGKFTAELEIDILIREGVSLALMLDNTLLELA